MPHRIGLIGLGTSALAQHLPAIADNPAFELIGAASLEGDLPDGAAPVFRNHADMLADLPDLEAVVICTPPQARLAVAADALAAGKHVLLEKPPTATTGGLAHLRRLAEHHDRVLFTAWHSQYNATVEKTADFLARRVVAGFDIVWKEDVRRYHPGQQWIWQPGGFGVFDAGINALSIISRILPIPPFVTAADLLIPANAEAPITAHVRFSNGQADFEWRCDGDPLREMTITTDDGHRLALTNTAGRLAIDDVVVIDGPRAEYAGIYTHFDKLLRDGTSFIDEVPLQLVADTFLLGRRIAVADFHE
jgi:D-galactose 1-dehydrogenase